MPSWLRLLLGVILGIVLLGRGLQWFNGYLDASQKPSYAAATTTPAAVPAPAAPAIPAAPAATPEEIAALNTGAPPDRFKAVEVLERRGATPELLAALDTAIDDLPSHATDSEWWARDSFESHVVCLRGRLADDDVADFASRHMPAGDPGSQSEEGRRATCLVKALAASSDVSDVSRDLLMRFLMSPTYERRSAALAGIKRWRFDSMPAELREQFFAPSESRRRMGVQAAAALGALEFEPEIFARALADPDNGVRSTARATLCQAGTPTAARMLAMAVVERADGLRLLESLRYDFKSGHTLWSAFAEIGGDEAEPEEQRARAIELLGMNGDRDQESAIQRLSQASSDVVRASAVAALAEHHRRHR